MFAAGGALVLTQEKKKKSISVYTIFVNHLLHCLVPNIKEGIKQSKWGTSCKSEWIQLVIQLSYSEWIS